jgi:hypothetical protein
LDRLVDVDEPESLWACEPALLGALASGVFAAFANDWLGAFAFNADARPPNTLSLVKGSGYALSLVAVEQTQPEQPREILSHAQHKLLLNLGPEELRFTLYQQTGTDRIDVFDPAAGLKAAQRRRLTPRSCLRLRAGIDVFDLPEAFGRTVLITLIGPTKFQTVTAYDFESLRPTRMFASQVAVTRAQYALAVLAELVPDPGEALTAAVGELLSHPSHVVRWAAASAMNAFSEDAGTAALAALRDDPHPHIRNAVQRSLELRHGA